VLVLVNGAPINSAMTGDADVSSIGLERAERVQVLTGTQSARYGGRALAGVVIVETRRAERELSGAASAGAWGERNASIAIGQTREGEDVRAAASITADYRDVRGDFSYDVPAVRGGGSTRRLNGDARSTGVLATASIDGANGEPGALQVRGEWQHRSRGLPGSIVQPSTTGRQRDSRLSGGLDGRWEFSRLTLTANADATREHAVFADPAPPFGSVYDDSINANSLMAASALSAGSASRSIAIGGEARTLGVTSSNLAPDAPRRQHQSGLWSTTHLASSAVHEVDLAADLSVRADWDPFIDGAVVSPRGVLTAAHGHGLVSASFGAGYTPPSLADQFFHEGVFVRANPSLRPERVRREVEVRAIVRDVSLGGLEGGAEAAAYRANIHGMILWQPNFQFIWSPSNFDVRRSGWELSAHVAARSIGADLRGSVTRSDVSYVGPVLGGQVAYRPRSTANVAAGVSRWNARLEVATRYVGVRRTVPGSGLNLLDAYSLTDVALSRAFTSASWRLDARIGADNVFDRAASMLVDYPFPGRAWTVGLRARRR
jgi:iron complex outermembrane receptor protein